jgi:3-oxoacyl-[acyl-carrier protein] reductase
VLKEVDDARQVIVSGGGSGIGRAVARRFALFGDRVTIVSRRGHVLAETAAAVNAEVGEERVAFQAADLSQPDEVERVVRTLADGGAVDVIINNCGGVGAAPSNGLAAVAADWEGEFRRNVLTAVLLTAALEPRLRRPGACIVNVSSTAALAGGGDSYSAAKAAILGWTIDLAVRLGGDRIRVNTVVPGYIEGTEFFGDRMTEERHERLIGRTLLGRAGVADDVAGCVFFLASADAAYVTGQHLHVNGGTVLGR